MTFPKLCVTLPGIRSMLGQYLADRNKRDFSSRDMEMYIESSPSLSPLKPFASASSEEKPTMMSRSAPSPARDHVQNIFDQESAIQSSHCVARGLPYSDLTDIQMYDGMKHDPSLPAAHFRISTNGWFKPDDYICQKVWQHFRQMPREKLLELFFERQDHSIFGENFKNSSMYTRRDDVTFAGEGGKKHPAKERERRNRHRVFQRMAHDSTPSCVLNMAKTSIDSVKEELPQHFPADFECMDSHPDQSPSPKGRKKNNASSNNDARGKDVQLLSSAMFPTFAAIVIQSEMAHSAKVEVELNESAKQKGLLEYELTKRDRLDIEKELLIEQQAAKIQDLLEHRSVYAIYSRHPSSCSSVYTPASSVSPRSSKRSLEDEFEILESVESSSPKRRHIEFSLPSRSRNLPSHSPSPSNNM